MKNGGEVFADFTTSRIIRSLEASEPLSEHQKLLVRDVLLAESAAQRHSVDIRLFVPLIFRNYYFCIFAGRDRRRSTLNLQTARWFRTRRRFSRLVLLFLLLCGSIIFGAVLIWGAYRLKSWLGIDLIPGWHFSEFVANLFAFEVE